MAGTSPTTCSTTTSISSSWGRSTTRNGKPRLRRLRAPDFYLVANPINRYSVGDRTRGLELAEDGAVTILMQADEPSTPEARANWLPTPEGDFRPLLRMYEPDAAVFDGRYELPPITKLTS